MTEMFKLEEPLLIGRWPASRLVSQFCSMILMDIVLTVPIATIVLRLRRKGIGGLNASGLASDFLSLLIFLDPLLEVFRLNQEDFKGQTLVGVAFAIFLFLLSRKVSRKEPHATPNRDG